MKPILYHITVSFELLRVGADLKGSLEECEICRPFSTHPLVRVKPSVSSAETPFHGFSRGTSRGIRRAESLNTPSSAGESAVSAQDCAGWGQDKFRKGCAFNLARLRVVKSDREAELSRELSTVSIGQF
jgi:hypothetical protein